MQPRSESLNGAWNEVRDHWYNYSHSCRVFAVISVRPHPTGYQVFAWSGPIQVLHHRSGGRNDSAALHREPIHNLLPDNLGARTDNRAALPSLSPGRVGFRFDSISTDAFAFRLFCRAWPSYFPGISQLSQNGTQPHESCPASLSSSWSERTGHSTLCAFRIRGSL